MKTLLLSALTFSLAAASLCTTISAAEAQSMRMEPLAADEIYRATGNEPFWSASIQGDTIRFEHMDEISAVGTYADPVRNAGTTAYIGRIEQRTGAMLENYPTGLPLIIMVEDRPCTDSMAGTPYPNIVRVIAANDLFTGCGGNPLSVLTGADWTVTRLTDTPVTGEPRMTINFGEDGRVSGFGGCNRFNASYELGEGIAFGPIMSTRRGCPGAIGENEQRLFTAMRETISMDAEEDGSVTLYSQYGPVVTLAR